MKTWEQFSEVGSNLASSAVTVGNFDGVHLGHQSVVQRLVEYGRKKSLPTVAIFFDPHPAKILGHPLPPRLTTLSTRSELLKNLGIDHLLIAPFTALLAQMSAKDFMENVISTELKAKFICIGPTTHVGRNREGTPDEIQRLGKSLGLLVDVAPPFLVSGKEVSSSRIRKALESGNIEEATACLGRYYFTDGQVIPGAGRGKGMGVPTANLGSIETMIPAQGVYATEVLYKDKIWKGATNVGTRPTFLAGSLAGTPQRGVPVVVETHLLDFQGEVKGPLRLHWLRRLREERKFSSADALTRQIQKDLIDVQNGN